MPRLLCRHVVSEPGGFITSWLAMTSGGVWLALASSVVVGTEVAVGRGVIWPVMMIVVDSLGFMAIALVFVVTIRRGFVYQKN